MKSRLILCFVAVALSASTGCGNDHNPATAPVGNDARGPDTTGDRAEGETKLTGNQVLEAISIFAEAPLSEDRQDIASILAKYADENSIVVPIDPGFYPWMAESPEVKHKQTLRVAVIAGNLQSYMTAQSAGDLAPGGSLDPTRAGLLFLFEIYNKLKANDTEFSIPLIEEQIQAHKNGKLRDYIQEHRPPTFTIELENIK